MVGTPWTKEQKKDFLKYWSQAVVRMMPVSLTAAKELQRGSENANGDEDNVQNNQNEGRKDGLEPNKDKTDDADIDIQSKLRDKFSPYFDIADKYIAM